MAYKYIETSELKDVYADDTHLDPIKSEALRFATRGGSFASVQGRYGPSNLSPLH
jgi:hypothetical protein